MTNRLPNSFRIAALALICMAAPVAAQAQLFGDDEARKAIVELRQRFDQAVLAQNRLVDENTQLRRNMLQLQTDIDGLHNDVAQLRGREDELEHQLAQMKQQQTPAPGATDGSSATSGNGAPDGSAPPAGGDSAAAGGGSVATNSATAASGDDRQELDAALRKFQGGNFRAAQTDLQSFVKREPNSALLPEALFWLGNAQYATQDYKPAIANFKQLLAKAPSDKRAPEALLSIASCQTELRDTKSARATLESLVKQYPQSQAAQAARDRLKQLK